MSHTMNIVVIGGSVGGLDSLLRVVAALPRDFDASLAVVLHTGENSPRLVPSIIERHTPLPVTYAHEGARLCSGRIYIAPPGAHLVVRAPDLLGLDHGPKVNHARPAVNRLFVTAAEVLRSRVIGVVLSGGDGDGTDGLIAIKAHGGLGIVQSPSDALAPSMPMTALMYDSPDYVTLVEDIGPLLAHLIEERTRA